mmetsp:Transcript_10664/g.20691  ORF Transcript_10664/g.20691 Transcript_10664/m.20691 type:complete len:491 (-) Transcript_10664:1997-3469(-)
MDSASKKQKSSAPFSSKTQRVLEQGFSYNPGPGAYEMPDKLVKPILYDQFGRKRSTAQFASRTKRFKWKAKSPGPGPGQYELRKDSKSSKTSHHKPERLGEPLWQRLQTAPSIPSLNQKFGYHETPEGELVLQKGAEVVHTGTKADSIGPGHYNIETGQKAGGTKWHKYGSKREDVAAKTPTKDLGPGAYHLSDRSFKSKVPSPFFKSSSKRIRPIADSEKGKETRSLSPGPGYYDPTKNLSIEAKYVPERLQFFGSCAARFQAQKDEYAEVGPGKYDSHALTISAKLPRDLKVPFSSGVSRFDAKVEEVPGPGAYRDQSLVDNLMKKVGASGSSFNSQRRFQNLSSDNSPGPGHYPIRPAKYVGSHNSANKKESSMFLSKVTKLADLSVKEHPAPGTYEMSLSKDMSDKSDSFFKHSPKRFKETKQDKLGPGYYTPQNLSKPRFENKGFINREARFKEREPEDSPGPGEYHEETQPKWTKQSHNALYAI